MPTITITSIGRQYILDNEDWKWIKQHLGVPLKLLSLNFSHNKGELFCVSILKEATEDSMSVITLFTDMNKLEYEVNTPW